MRAKQFGRIVATSACLAIGVVSIAQEKKADPKAAEAEMAEWAKLQAPGPQHAMLAKMAGEWDAAVTLFMPDGVKMESKAKEKCELVLGGRFVQSVFTGTMMEMPFEGRGTTGYDNLRKVYFSTWTDSMSTCLMVFEGTADETGKVITMHAESKGVDGQVEKWRSVTTLIDDTHYTFDMYATRPGGKEVPVMSVKYTRAK
jgi:hypothetical protein